MFYLPRPLYSWFLVTYRAISKLSPVCFHNYFTPKTSFHRIGTRQFTIGDLFFPVRGPPFWTPSRSIFGSTLWNTVPLFIRVADSISLFRSKSKAYYVGVVCLSLFLHSTKFFHFLGAHLVHRCLSYNQCS